MPKSILVLRPPKDKNSSRAIAEMPKVVEMIIKAKPESVNQVLEYVISPDNYEGVFSLIDSTNPPIIIFFLYSAEKQMAESIVSLGPIIKAAHNIAYVMVIDPKTSQDKQNELTYYSGRLQKEWENTPVKVINVNITQSTLTEEQQKKLNAVCNSLLSDQDLEKVGIKRAPTPNSAEACSIM
jgi:hypothetical protein